MADRYIILFQGNQARSHSDSTRVDLTSLTLRQWFLLVIAPSILVTYIYKYKEHFAVAKYILAKKNICQEKIQKKY